jgi:hypothetical protein
MRRPLAAPVALIGLIASTLVAAMAVSPSPASMASAATAFLESLTPEQRRQATFHFDSSERTRWHFIPTETFPRNGLTIKDMTEPQRKLAHDLLRAGLSQRGYLTVTQIMELERVLATLEAAQRAARGGGGGGRAATGLLRDSERYFFSIFGSPSIRTTWGWRVEGHHLSLHFTLVNGTFVAASPTFLGTNPAEVREGPSTGLRILGPQEDAARALLMALDSAQRTRAIINAAAPNDILTMNQLPIAALSPEGIPASALRPDQRALLMKIIDVYAGYMADDVAADRLARLKKGGEDRITFAWAGSMDRGQRHYYRVQGPTFLIEYDNTQNNANHVHSVWRDFNGDFGADLLREHLRRTPHN